MCTPILKLLPTLLLYWIAFGHAPLLATSKLDLSGILPFEASYLKALKPAQNTLVSDVILVGGKEAMLLDLAFKSILRDKISSKIRVSSMTAPEFNLARLYSLFTYHAFAPQWIIYLPSIDDEKEEIFDIKDMEALQYNLKRGQTWWWQLLYKIWPGLALSTLKKIQVIKLEQDPTFHLAPLSDAKKIQHSLTNASLYKMMMEQWILSAAKTNFLLISTPFDPNSSPQNCKTSVTWPTKNFIKEQLSSMKEKKWDQALEANDYLRQVAPYYASTYYTRAKILHQLQNTEDSFRFLHLSWMLNCRSPYIALKNTIMQSMSSTFPGQVYFYDLTKFVSDECFVKDPTCFQGEELNPSFYQSAAQAISLLISEKMK